MMTKMNRAAVILSAAATIGLASPAFAIGNIRTFKADGAGTKVVAAQAAPVGNIRTFKGMIRTFKGSIRAF